ncbi:hypothetical protein [Klebsiella grimontii]|uniref:hypothetical protein n=1 Tax=Klebsiella grimontii TaxID=2058152 RepID=UPI00104BE8E4|nr:hypothetical protein [Klebsiella grimontii]TCZ55655.1 hypothetical protein E0D83_26390 [Klebsiella grimontii]
MRTKINTISLLLPVMLLAGCDKGDIDSVKEFRLADGSKVGAILENREFCKQGEWKKFTNESGKDIVEYKCVFTNEINDYLSQGLMSKVVNLEDEIKLWNGNNKKLEGNESLEVDIENKYIKLLPELLKSDVYLKLKTYASKDDLTGLVDGYRRDLYIDVALQILKAPDGKVSADPMIEEMQAFFSEIPLPLKKDSYAEKIINSLFYSNDPLSATTKLVETVRNQQISDDKQKAEKIIAENNKTIADLEARISDSPKKILKVTEVYQWSIIPDSQPINYYSGLCIENDKNAALKINTNVNDYSRRTSLKWYFYTAAAYALSGMNKFSKDVSCD